MMRERLSIVNVGGSCDPDPPAGSGPPPEQGLFDIQRNCQHSDCMRVQHRILRMGEATSSQ